MYKLYNGDCLEIMDKLISEGIKVDAIITDPPYGVTDCEWDNVIPFNSMWERLDRIIKEDKVIALFGSEPFSSKLRVSNFENYKYDWYWEKTRNSNPSLVKSQPLRYVENIMIFSKCNSKVNYYPIMQSGEKYKTRKGAGGGINLKVEERNTRYPKNIIEIKSCYPNTTVHPTQKPVELMEYLIKTYTKENETVLDFTMGSGSTGVACMNTDRNFIGIEKDVNYFNTAKERIEEAEKINSVRLF